MEKIPVEILEKFFSYLSPNDLLSCSQVNVFWRNASNDNRLWRNHCMKVFNVENTSKPIIEEKCRSKPFKTPKNRSRRFSDLCPWRIRYAQEMHIYKNWIYKRYSVAEYQEELENIPQERHNSHIIGHTFIAKNTNFDIYNFDNGAEAEIELPPGEIDRFIPLKNGFAFIQNGILTYYTMKNNQLTLQIKTSIDKPFLKTNIPFITNEHFEPVFYNYKELSLAICHNERYLVVSRLFKMHLTFLVWDLKSIDSFVFDLKLTKTPSFISCPDNYYSRLLYTPYVGMALEGSKLYTAIYSRDLSTATRLSDTIFIHDLKNPHVHSEVPVEKMTYTSMKAINDFLAICYKDKVSFLRKGKISSIECDMLGSRFKNRILASRSYICALGRNDENLEIILTDHDFNLKRRLNYWKPSVSYDRYFLNLVGPDLLGVTKLGLQGENGQLWDLKKFRRSDLIADVINTAKTANNKIAIDYLTKKVYYFW